MLYTIATIIMMILFHAELNTTSLVFAIIAIMVLVIAQFIQDLRFNDMVHRMHGSHIAMMRITKDLCILHEDELNNMEEPDYGRE